MDAPCGNYFVPSFWGLEFRDGSWIFGKFAQPSVHLSLQMPHITGTRNRDSTKLQKVLVAAYRNLCKTLT
jgi:hypothetical protein